MEEGGTAEPEPLLTKHEIDRSLRNLLQLRFIAKRAFEHGEAARHRDDVERRALRLSPKLASPGALQQGVLNERGDATDQIREGLARGLVQPFAFG